MFEKFVLSDDGSHTRARTHAHTYTPFFRIWYDIFVNCNWVVTRWQKYNTHLHTNNTQNDTKHTIHRTTQQFRGRADLYHFCTKLWQTRLRYLNIKLRSLPWVKNTWKNLISFQPCFRTFARGIGLLTGPALYKYRPQANRNLELRGFLCYTQ
jgi:hypothetical protein